jgi:glycosyltransferase involved in cell wall biosynthesis
MPADTPRITVIIPTYNYPAALKCAIRSVLGQTWQDFELLVMGDGCTDDTAAVVDSFGDERVQFHNLPENSGSQAAPNNAGLALARGEVVAWHGHDDLWLPFHLETLHGRLRESGAAWAHSVCLWIGPPEFPYRSAHGFNAQDLGEIKPSQLMVRREAAVGVRWPAMNELPPGRMTEWVYMERLEGAAGPGATLPLVTALKLPASHRRGSYAAGTAHEQEALLEKMAAEPQFAEHLLTDALDAYAHGKHRHPAIEGLDGTAKGHTVEMLRRLRGLPPLPEYGDTEPRLVMVTPETELAAVRAQIAAMEATRVWRLASAWWALRDRLLGRA